MLYCLVGLGRNPKFGPRAIDFEWPNPSRARFWVALPSLNLKNRLRAEKLAENRPKFVARWLKMPSPTQPGSETKWPIPTQARKKMARPSPSTAAEKQLFLIPHFCSIYVAAPPDFFLGKIAL